MARVHEVVAGVLCAIGVGGLFGCEGAVGGLLGIDGPTLSPQDFQLEPSAARRMTRREYDATLELLLGDATRSGALLLPQDTLNTDTLNPFNNDYTLQSASTALIESLERLAED